MQVPMNKSRVTSNDVFILDKGLEIYQWNGKSCNKDEKFKVDNFFFFTQGRKLVFLFNKVDNQRFFFIQDN